MKKSVKSNYSLFTIFYLSKCMHLEVFTTLNLCKYCSFALDISTQFVCSYKEV